MNKLGLCLSGGAARGAYHLGVLKALVELDIRPDIISGTSAGAIAATLYASGVLPEEMLTAIQGAKWIKMFRWSVPNKGLLKDHYLRQFLEKFLRDKNFSDLDLPVVVCASNIELGQPEYFNKGSVVDAVVASSSIPLVFEPCELNGTLYLDGGLLKNMPASIIRPECAYLIGVNLIPRVSLGRDQLNGVTKIAGRMFDLAVYNNIFPELSLCDSVIESEELWRYNKFNFSKPKELYELGYQATMDQSNQFLSSL